MCCVSWYDIAVFVVPMIMSLIEGCCLVVMLNIEWCMVATMTWLIVTEYLCLKLPQICSICSNHNPVPSSFITYHSACNTTAATNGAGTGYPLGAPEFAPLLTHRIEVYAVRVTKLHVFSILESCCDRCSVCLYSHLFCKGSCLFMLSVLIQAY